MPPSIQVYEGSGAPAGIAVRRMLKKPLPKKPLYLINRVDEQGGHSFLTIEVRGPGDTYGSPYFSIKWQGGSGRDKSLELECWYGGEVTLATKRIYDLNLRVRWLQKLIKRLGTVDCDPMLVIESLEAIGIVQGALDEVADAYRPIDKLVPLGFARWWEEHTTSSMTALDVVAENEDEARALLDARMAAHGYYDNRLDAWRAAGRPVRKGREAKLPRWTKADVPYKRVI